MSNHFSGVHPPADVSYPQTNSIYGSLITLTILATIAVILRFVARKKSKAPFSYDDYSMVLALVCLYGLNISIIVAAAKWGLGKSFFTLSKTQILHFQKYGLSNFVLYFSTNAVIKISLLLLYYRLFSPSRPFRIAVYINAVIVISWWIAVVLASIFQCVPINAFWNFRVAKTAKCMNTASFGIGGGVSNLLTDVMVLCLPLPMVWSLSTNRAQKITLTGIFLLGFFVCAISIIRIVKLVFPGYFDPTYNLTGVFIWTSAESSVGIISACLPIMRPLFGRWLFGAVTTISKSNKTPSAKKTNSSSQLASANLSSPVRGGFTRLEGPTDPDQLKASYRDRMEPSSSRNSSVMGSGGPVANGTYSDEEGASWVLFGPSKGDNGEGRLEEGMQMQEWPRRRNDSDWAHQEAVRPSVTAEERSWMSL